MALIKILGGTGYAGSHIASTGTTRGHKILSYSKNLPAEKVNGVTYITGDLRDEASLATACSNADVVISALSARGPLAKEMDFRTLLRRAALIAAQQGIRFGVIGGAGSLLRKPGGPRFVDTPEFLEIAKPEALILAAVLEDLYISDPRLDWFFVSPAANFGPHAPGKTTGNYRIGGDILLYDENGNSDLSGGDLGLAVINEVENPEHHRKRLSVVY